MLSVAIKRIAEQQPKQPQIKKGKLTLPKLVGKRVQHRWCDQTGKETWYHGKVVCALGDVGQEECQFEVLYDNDPTPYQVQLYDDLEKKDLIIL